MIFQNIEEITESLVLVPVGVLGVAILGLVLAGPLATLCALVAHQRGYEWRIYALAGAKCSVLLILPAVYLLLRLLFGKTPFPRFVIVSVYVLIYLLWIACIAINTNSILLFVYDILFGHHYSLGATMLLTIIFGTILPINVYSWTSSVKYLQTSANSDRQSKRTASPSTDIERYSKPFTWIILWSLVIVLMTLIAGLIGFVGT